MWWIFVFLTTHHLAMDHTERTSGALVPTTPIVQPFLHFELDGTPVKFRELSQWKNLSTDRNNSTWQTTPSRFCGSSRHSNVPGTTFCNDDSHTHSQGEINTSVAVAAGNKWLLIYLWFQILSRIISETKIFLLEDITFNKKKIWASIEFDVWVYWPEQWALSHFKTSDSRLPTTRPLFSLWPTVVSFLVTQCDYKHCFMAMTALVSVSNT